MATAIQQSVYDQTHPKPHHVEREQVGPLKEILGTPLQHLPSSEREHTADMEHYSSSRQPVQIYQRMSHSALILARETDIWTVGGPSSHTDFVLHRFGHHVGHTLHAPDPVGSQGWSIFTWRYAAPHVGRVLIWALGTDHPISAVSIAEFVSRSFGPNTFMSHLRPKKYKKVPEPLLNGTLKDIHDFVQYGVVQAQRIAYGQDLDKTFAVSRRHCPQPVT